MARDTGTTLKPITLASAFRLSILETTPLREFLAILCCTNVFSIWTCADVYRLLCMVQLLWYPSNKHKPGNGATTSLNALPKPKINKFNKKIK